MAKGGFAGRARWIGGQRRPTTQREKRMRRERRKGNELEREQERRDREVKDHRGYRNRIISFVMWMLVAWIGLWGIGVVNHTLVHERSRLSKHIHVPSERTPERPTHRTPGIGRDKGRRGDRGRRDGKHQRASSEKWLHERWKDLRGYWSRTKNQRAAENAVAKARVAEMRSQSRSESRKRHRLTSDTRAVETRTAKPPSESPVKYWDAIWQPKLHTKKGCEQ